MAITWKKLAFATDISTEIDGDIATMLCSVTSWLKPLVRLM